MQSKIFSIFALNYALEGILPSMVNYISIIVFVSATSIPLLPSYMVFIMGYFRKISELIGIFFIRAVTMMLNANVSLKRIEVLKFFYIINWL